MKKHLKRILIIVFVFVITITLTGCDGKKNNGTSSGKETNGMSWPTNISYVPNITYEGKGKIIDIKEDTDWGSQYMIYIKGADLKSANAYVDKLYENGYQVLNIYSDEGKYLKEPNKNNSFKMGYENEDGSINVVVVMHDGKDNYNLVITFADMNS